MFGKEKSLVRDLEKSKSLDDSIRIYETLLLKYPDKINYWDEYIRYILANYKQMEVDSWVEILEKALSAARKATKLFSNHSRFYVYECKIMIELIKVSPFPYTARFPDNILLETLDKAYSINNNNADVYLLRGNIFAANNERDKAEENYQKALNLNNINYDFMFLLDKAINNELSNNYKQAIEDYQLIIDNEKDDSLLSIVYGRLVGVYEKEDNITKVNYYKSLMRNQG